jgi:hypothetical protein
MVTKQLTTGQLVDYNSLFPELTALLHVLQNIIRHPNNNASAPSNPPCTPHSKGRARKLLIIP